MGERLNPSSVPPIRKADEIGPLKLKRPVPRGADDCDVASIPAALQGPPAVRDEALTNLRALLLRGARFDLSRSRDSLSHLSDAELDALAIQAADDALVAILTRLESFRGASRFTTWASKFAVHEAGLKRRALADIGPSPEANVPPGRRDSACSADS
jgi:hypothetical protein